MAQAAPKRIWLVDRIVDVLIDGLNTGSLSVEKASTLAKQVLAQLDTLKDEQHVIAFLGELTQQYEKFQPLQVMVQGLFERKRETQTAQQVMELIKNGDAKAAINLAKTKTEQ